MIWAFAVADQTDVQLFEALAMVIKQRAADLNSKHLSSTAWAFARSCLLNAQLFMVLAGAAEHHGGNFNVRGCLVKLLRMI